MAQWSKVWLLLTLGATLSYTVVAQENQSFELDAVPSKDKPFDRGAAPAYVEQDEFGRLFVRHLNQLEDGAYFMDKVFIDKQDVVEVETAGYQIKIIPEKIQDNSVQPADEIKNFGEPKSLKSASCPLPSQFSIFNWWGTIFGNSHFELSSNRPNNTTTQWLVYDFKTSQMANQPVHTPGILFYKPTLHGWGAFWGNNTLSPRKCTTPNVTMNTQIEAWSNVAGCTGSACQSNTFSSGNDTNNKPNSCGATNASNKLEDGITYRMTIRASTGKWVTYKVEKKVGNNSYVPHFGWRTVQVNGPSMPTSNPWLSPPPSLDSTAEGIALAVSGSPLPGGGSNNGFNWSVSFSKVNCGWF